MKIKYSVCISILFLFFSSLFVCAEENQGITGVCNDGTIQSYTENNQQMDANGPAIEAKSTNLEAHDSESLGIEYTNPAEEAAYREAIFGNDNRKFVGDTTNFPYSAVTQLVITFGNKQYVGTGDVIANKYILTAAHNLYDIDTESWAKSISVIPGAYPKGNNAVGTSYKKELVKKMTVPDSWINTLSPSEDIGIIELKESIGQYTGNFGITTTPSNDVTLTGFHADKYTQYGQPRMTTESNHLTGSTNNFVTYHLDNWGGSSGSGLYNKNNYQIFAINAYGPNGYLSDSSAKSNSAVRINQKWYNFISLTTKQTPPHQSIKENITIVSDNYTLWSSFINWSKSKNRTVKKGDIYRAKYKYTHFNGRTYYSLYDNQNNWIGYLDAAGLSEFKAQSYRKNVTIKSQNYTYWNNFFWNSKKGNTQHEKGKYYNARYIYHIGDGTTYLSLYDNNGHWKGYVNQRATADVSPTSVNKNITITKPNYNLWNNFYWSKKLGNTNGLIGDTYYAKYSYQLGNGQTYYSLYDVDNRWIGYVNTSATKKNFE